VVTTLVDQDATEILAKEAIDAVLDLENMGLPFNRTPERGKIDQRRFGGHTPVSTASAGSSILLRGRPHRPHMIQTLFPELRQTRHQLLQRVLRARPGHDRGDGCLQ
jgi:succinate dehydrogenase/fumarate reductase flavoprotein subunit